MRGYELAKYGFLQTARCAGKLLKTEYTRDASYNPRKMNMFKIILE